MENRAEEAESRGGTMPVMGDRGKLHVMYQRMRGGLQNVTLHVMSHNPPTTSLTFPEVP